jgi:hypothetical protein
VCASNLEFFKKLQTIIRARKYEILKAYFNQLLELKTRNMMNGKGATETPDDWEALNFKK